MEWTWIDDNQREPSGDSESLGVSEPSLAERIEYLCRWEQRGRGYEVFPEPVALEPAYVPYNQAAPQEWSAPVVQPAAASVNWQARSLVLAEEQTVTPHLCESFLTALRGLRLPLAFEILGDASAIHYQLCCAPMEQSALASHFVVHFPASHMRNAEDRLRQLLEPLRHQPIGYAVVDFGLYCPFYQPLKRFTSYAPDPLTGLVGVLGHLRNGEVAGYQVLFTPVRGDWSAAIRQVSIDASREAIARHKIGGHLFACVLRVFGVSRQGNEHAFALCQNLGDTLTGITEPGSNWLIAVDNQNYPDKLHFADLLARQSRRAGMLLASSELASLVHPPAESLTHQKLARLDLTERPLPAGFSRARGIILGHHRYREVTTSVVWPDGMRNRHCYLLGATRMGKSTLILNMLRQDMESGRGLCLIDPHGDLARDALALVPAERAADSYYFDLSDRDFPVALGLFQSNTEGERALLSSDIVSIFHRLFTSSWGDRLEHILRYVLLTLLAAPGHTLRDLRLILAHRGYRERVVAALTDSELISFWKDEFPGYPSSSFAPIYNKIGLLLSSPLLRNIVAQGQNRLDMGACIAGKKILIVNLCQGLIGEDNAAFLGAFLVSRIQIAAMQTLRQEAAQRVPFTLYADEFQHFVVSSFEKILSEAGKVLLSLVMANQFLGQLGERLQRAVLGNVGNLICFQCGPADAHLLEKEFGGRFSYEDVLNLERGQAIVRIGPAQDSFRLATLPPPARSLADDSELRAQIVAQTRAECCRPRSDIEAEIEERQQNHTAAQLTSEKDRTPSDVRDGEPEHLSREEPLSFGLSDDESLGRRGE
jgi:hypothetical protein